MRQVKQTDSNVRERLEFLLESDTSIESRTDNSAKESIDLLTPLLRGADSDIARALSVGLAVATLVLWAAPELPSKVGALIPSTTAIQRLFTAPIVASNSTITGVVDPLTMSSSFYWTVVLKSNTGESEEATADILLPDGAVVSRATLWVNGIPQEAAFNGTGAVSSAYESVAHPWYGGFGDPLLVTWAGPNRVKIKASPVPANGEMQIRLGITAPLHLDQEGKAIVSLPFAENGNFSIAKQDVHLESQSKLSTSQWFANVSRKSSGRSVLRANPSPDRLKDFIIEAERPADVRQVATRATHAGKPAFIVMTINDNDGELNVSLTKQDAKPNCRIISSDHAAYRLSSLWAGQEINRLIEEGQTQGAVQVGTVYRVVSQVTGATVLEQNSQYGEFGLHRNRYMVLSENAGTGSGFAPFSFPQPTSTTVGPADAFSAGDYITGTQTQSLSPMLQGATNGTIGPQSADATVVNGIKTASTIRRFDPGPYAWVDDLLRAVFNAGPLSQVQVPYNIYAATKELLSWMALIGGTLLAFIALRFAMCLNFASRNH